MAQSTEFFCNECGYLIQHDKGFQLIGSQGLTCTDCMSNQFGFEYDELDAKPCRHLATAACSCEQGLPDYHVMHNSFRRVVIRATDHRESFAANTHRIVLREETADSFVGWPDPTDKRNSEHWQPGIDRPMVYPKFAWEIA